jgi:hypothetical protein
VHVPGVQCLLDQAECQEGRQVDRAGVGNAYDNALAETVIGCTRPS